MSRYLSLLAVILLSLLIPPACQADSSILWQIGKFNDSSLEFHQGAPSQDPVFVVGTSDPARDWHLPNTWRESSTSSTVRRR